MTIERVAWGRHSPEKNKGYVVIAVLLCMSVVLGLLGTTFFLVRQEKEVQILRVDRLRAEALVISALAVNNEETLPVLMPGFIAADFKKSPPVPPMALPLPGSVYVFRSGGDVWAVGVYADVVVVQKR